MDGQPKAASYTGEGQKALWNLFEAINPSATIKDGKDIFLFEDNKKEKGVRYLGMFECDSWDHIQCLDFENNMRQGITFNLFKVSSLHAVEEEPETDEADTQTETLEQLRKKALQSSKQSGQRQQSDSKNPGSNAAKT